MSVAVDPSDAITRLREVEASGGTHHIYGEERDQGRREEETLFRVVTVSSDGKS